MTNHPVPSALYLHLQVKLAEGLTGCPHLRDDDTHGYWVASVPGSLMCDSCADQAPTPLRCDVCSKPGATHRWRLPAGPSITVFANVCRRCLPGLRPGGAA